MRTFLLSSILTIAVAASLIVIIDRFRSDGDHEVLREVSRRMNSLEQKLDALEAEPASAAAKPARPTGQPPKRPKSDARLSEVITLLEEVEGMILDAEKGLRRDLRGIYEKLLARIEELQLSGSGGGTDALTKKAVRDKLEEMGVRVIEEEQMVELRGEILEPSRALELIAVAPGGRAHEALVLLDVTPSALKIGLEDIGLVETDADPDTGRYPEGAGHSYVYITWEGLKKPRRIEDTILNRRTNESMKRTAWCFTASRFYTDTRTWERHFAADVYKNVIALTWNWSVESVLACPLEEAADENIWAPSENTCAPAGTKVRLLIRKEPHPQWDTY